MKVFDTKNIDLQLYVKWRKVRGKNVFKCEELWTWIIYCTWFLLQSKSACWPHYVSTWWTPWFYACILKFCSPWQVVQRMVTEILTVPGVSRVLYDLTAKPPGTTEWEWCRALSLIAFYTKLRVTLVGLECGASVVIHSRTSALLGTLWDRLDQYFSLCLGLTVQIICDKLTLFQRESAVGWIFKPKLLGGGGQEGYFNVFFHYTIPTRWQLVVRVQCSVHHVFLYLFDIWGLHCHLPCNMVIPTPLSHHKV